MVNPQIVIVEVDNDWETPTHTELTWLGKVIPLNAVSIQKVGFELTTKRTTKEIRDYLIHQNGINTGLVIHNP